MIKNFFRVALRSLLKHRVFSFINIFGLAIGIAASLLILQYTRFERSYDKFEANASRIYRVQQDRYNEGRLTTQWAAGAAGIGLLLKEAFPEIQAVARLHDENNIMSYKEKFFREDHMFYATDEFLSMFSYPALQGSVTGALKDPFTAVLTASTARKYFGNEDPIGKTIDLNKVNHYKIMAVLPDPPVNTHLKFSMLFSFVTLEKFAGPSVNTTSDWDGFFTYILLRPGADPGQLEKKIPALIEKKWGEQLNKGKEGVVYHLQALPDIHLSPTYMVEAEPNGDRKAVSFLEIIALFIIVIAWINYINLATARSIERAKEVGIRKTLGSLRGQLIGQFLFESFLINLLAVIIAFVLVLLFLPVFNTMAGKSLTFSTINNTGFWYTLVILFSGGTVLSGLYPAFVLSSFKPIAVLKGRFSGTTHGSLLRQSLVIGQFVASVLLMAGTFTVYRQLHFMQHEDLGIKINQTLVVKFPRVTDSTVTDRLAGFRTEVLHIPGVTRVSASTEVPGRKVGWNAGGIREVGADPSKIRQYRVIGIDYDFVDAYGLKVIKGRNISRQFADSDAVLFNLAAVKEMGFNKPEEVLNKRIEFWGKQYTIVGVVSNHHQESPRQVYDAHIFRMMDHPIDYNYFSVKLTAGRESWPAVVAAVKQQYANFFPSNPFDYFFLDDHYAEQYRSDEQFGQIFGLFAGLAIFVSCLGLLGLASFVTNQRTKEIGIRKIVGAGVGNILLLLTKDFLKPVLLAFLIATPLAWYILGKWLENYAFRITLTPWMFVLPLAIILVVALLTTATQTLRAATANPVKNLRTE
ncbi:MAG: ABC transporter permease [Sphingobacteriales bacterium 50-39]|nr:ABC transporter permease [Sphingobacteriales bacterium]OJW56078.1 MAG: ABC transporter permease [Sphingobacteriales bacterium 50-39]